MLNCSAFLFYSTQKLRPRGLELQQGELGDLVEQEMAATSAAVESAAARIEVCVCVYMCGHACVFMPIFTIQHQSVLFVSGC